jgi:hypothetical protein
VYSRLQTRMILLAALSAGTRTSVCVKERSAFLDLFNKGSGRVILGSASRRFCVSLMTSIFQARNWDRSYPSVKAHRSSMKALRLSFMITRGFAGEKSLNLGPYFKSCVYYHIFS